jgi:hypothetical protein
MLLHGPSRLELAGTLLAVVLQYQRHLDDRRVAVPQLHQQLDHAGEALLFDEALAVVSDGAA